MNSLKSQSGMFLLEASLAVVILIVGLTAIMHNLMSGVRVSRYTQEASVAVNLAERELWKAMAQQAGQSEYTQTAHRFNKDYIMDVVELGTHQANEQLDTIEMNISWRTGIRNNRIQFNTAVLRNDDI